MNAEQRCNLGLDGLRQQCSRTVAQHLGKSSWLMPTRGRAPALIGGSVIVDATQVGGPSTCSEMLFLE
jgi:hypothetical protein